MKRVVWQNITVGKSEYSKIDDGEFLLRRIHKNNYDQSHQTSVKRPAFEPGKNDDDGLSFHREVFISAKTLAYCGRKPGEYVIARFSVKDFTSDEIRLAVQEKPDEDQPPGHCVLPKLNTSFATQQKGPAKELQRKLAVMASARIIYKPPGL
ncbi:MAG TPA: hypothetical protein VFC46_09110 [Humisphaera sp.]|nr:hypothetical protein [Humisphaera sp.]